VDHECIQAYETFKIRKAGVENKRYIKFKFTDDLRSIRIEEIGEANSTYQAFAASLPDRDCRFAVFFYQYTAGGEGDRDKILFISWAPEGCPIKQKVLVTSSKDSLKKALNFVGTDIQATDRSEVNEDAIKDKLRI